MKISDTTTHVLTINKKGELQNAYSPLLNLINKNNLLGDFTTDKLSFNLYNPVDIIVTDEFDGSNNLIINDDVNTPKLINSRFSVLENNTFNIPTHSGNSVTNVYEDNTFDKDTLLLKLYNNIPDLQFNGLAEGGLFKCGSYIFYFKMSDSCGNMTNIILESGIVQVHIGHLNSNKIRMGMQDEDSKKCIKFKLKSLDKGFDYIRIFYERTSTDNSLAIIKLYYMIDLNFPIINLECDVVLTGSENTILIQHSDIQNEFADILTAKTQTIVDNTLFVGNISSYEQDYQHLLQLAWRIVPTAQIIDNIGNLNSIDYSYLKTNLYYNVNNVYNHTGYWPNELYRFGVVFIYDNNLLSPVFNIQGCKLQLKSEILDINEYYKSFFEDIGQIPGTLTHGFSKRTTESEDGFFNGGPELSNSKGVVQFPDISVLNTSGSGMLNPKVMKINFDLSRMLYKGYGADANSSSLIGWQKECDPKDSSHTYEDLQDLFTRNHIKGLFFVRLKRIPTIIALGMVVGLTGRYFGSIPVIKNDNGWCTKSFLSTGRTLSTEGSSVRITTPVTNKALLVPDYEINELSLNQIFTGAKFTLDRIALTEYRNHNDYSYVNNIKTSSEAKRVHDVKLTAVPKQTKIITDGENYFSSLAGNPLEAYKTSDVNYKWRETVPQKLTVSTSLIRGNWGSYVGMSCDLFDYGDIVTIRLNNWKDKNHINIEFSDRFKDFSLYSSISDRINVSQFGKYGIKTITCSRGDCFPTLFTHRMMSNFIDPELPTNKLIVDPSCWAKNYAVRCTAEILDNTHSNLTSDSEGWYVPSPGGRRSAIVSLIFGLLTGNIGSVMNSISQLNDYDASPSIKQREYANEIALAFEIYVGGKNETTAETITNPNKSSIDTGLISYSGDTLKITDANGKTQTADNIEYTSVLKKLCQEGHIKKVNSSEQRQEGLNLKAIFKASDKWELHGLASINRADVNAVSFGQWITFPICSSYNLALRDIDFNQAVEESSLLKKRSFYPYEEMDIYNHLLESGVINGAAKVSLSSNQRPAYMTVPYIKLEYFNRIYWSKPNVSENFINSYRMIFSDLYREYNKEFGAITKIMALDNHLLVVFQHGIGTLLVNKSAQTALEASPYLSSRSVLPPLLNTLSRDYGSMWKDSIIQSTATKLIYGVDTVAKKIWRTNGGSVEFISNFKVLKFLNDWIDLSEYNFNVYQGHINVKTHYNAFKQDVIFTYYKDIPMSRYEYIKNPKTLEYEKLPIGSLWHYTNEWELNKTNVEDVEYKEVDLSGNLILDDTLDPKILIEKWEPGKTWSLCFNEVNNNFVTFYDWYPMESCNIDNIFFSFDKDLIDDVLNKSVKSDSIYVHPDATFTVPEGINKLTTNKVFIDKINTCIVDYYVNNSSSKKTISINAPSSYTISGKNPKLYLSFYIKRQASYTIGDFIESGAFGYTYDASETPWKLMRKQIALGSKVDIIVPNDTSIANIHFTEIDEDKCSITTSGPFAYLELRDTETNKMFLWKHGLAGLYDNLGRIRPTNWYGKQHEFNFEFVVNELPTVLKIFNNLKLISNKTEPNKFEYEVVGEGYEWFELKPVIQWINDKYNENTTAKGSEKETFEYWYKEVLTKKYSELTNTYLDFPELFGKDDEYKLQKLPFLHLETADRKGLTDKNKTYSDTDYWTPLSPNNDFDYKYSFNTSETILVEDELLNEQRVHTELLGNDMKKYGRIRGNMLYLEDLWDIEIRPVLIKWAYINGTELKFTSSKETRHRDKYIKIKVRYTGKDLAVILGIITMFDISYA